MNLVKFPSIENGPGVRCSVFIPGCNIHCEGCHNSSLWEFTGFPKELMTEIEEDLQKEYCEGLSILGGEPLDERNFMTTVALILTAKRFKKSVWLYTGYLWENLPQYIKTDLKRFLTDEEDTLVDGPFVISERLPEGSDFRGSKNQRIRKFKDLKS